MRFEISLLRPPNLKLSTDTLSVKAYAVKTSWCFVWHETKDASGTLYTISKIVTTQTLIHSTGKLALSITPVPTYQQEEKTRLAWMDVGIVKENGHVEPLVKELGFRCGLESKLLLGGSGGLSK